MKIAIITSCSKRKLETIIPTKAIDLYQGQFFLGVKSLASVLKADLFIISAKYGWVPSDRLILPYNQRINTLSEARKIGIKIESNLLELKAYDLIIILAGAKYIEALKPIQDWHNVIIGEDNRGCGGFNQLIHSLNHHQAVLEKILSLHHANQTICVENLK
jgi:hypothetical protein